MQIIIWHQTTSIIYAPCIKMCAKLKKNQSNCDCRNSGELISKSVRRVSLMRSGVLAQQANRDVTIKTKIDWKQQWKVVTFKILSTFISFNFSFWFFKELFNTQFLCGHSHHAISDIHCIIQVKGVVVRVDPFLSFNITQCRYHFCSNQAANCAGDDDTVAIQRHQLKCHRDNVRHCEPGVLKSAAAQSRPRPAAPRV